MTLVEDTRTRPCRFANAIAERQGGAPDRNDAIARRYLLCPENAQIAGLLLRVSNFRQGRPLLPPSACLPLLP